MTYDHTTEIVLAFLLGFILSPFQHMALLFIGTIIIYEMFIQLRSTDPICFTTRMFIILMTVFGRLLGELFFTVLCNIGHKNLCEWMENNY
jgi:hypothetical protein